MKHLKIHMLLLLMTAMTTYAQDGAVVEKQIITTDRPDQTESPYLVPVGALQVETGFIVEDTKSGKDYTYNTTLVKYGVSENFELRLIQEVLGSEGQIAGEKYNHSGLSPLSLGVKIRIAEASGLVPKTSLIGHVTFPTGSDDVNTVYVTSDFRFTMEWGLSDRFSMGINLGGEGDGESPLSTGIYTFVIGYSISDKIGMFTEMYGFITEKDKEIEGSDVTNDHRFNGGFTYKISKVIQYDVSAGVGLSETSHNYFLSTGLSFRLFK